MPLLLRLLLRGKGEGCLREVIECRDGSQRGEDHKGLEVGFEWLERSERLDRRQWQYQQSIVCRRR